ncbi:MAG: hypothetical protein RLY70_536 [Planctomycetota bacterium]|jgi:hypothetical protein
MMRVATTRRPSVDDTNSSSLASMARMITPHLVRVGVLGQVGRFMPVALGDFPRGTRVVCRTVRGLELGEVLAIERTAVGVGIRATDGELLRRMTVADELLAARLERRKDEAFTACQTLLMERRIAATLVDVEHLFDGQSVYFYFLGTPPPDCEPVTDELARAYGAAARFEQFADSLELGCGPDCGTEDGAGCGSSGGCSTCALVSACAKH